MIKFLIFSGWLAVISYIIGFVQIKKIFTNKNKVLPNSTFVSAKIIFIIIDALRYDYFMPNENKEHYHNNFQYLNKLYNQEKDHALFMKVISDPPTTTAQRLRAMTVGSIPTIFEIKDTFNDNNILQDNLIHQWAYYNKKIAFLGDDTWATLFSDKLFHTFFSYPSFIVKDLHTVDNGIINNMFSLLQPPIFDVVIAHFLGVDHCGHWHGINHLLMKDKLLQMDNFIKDVIDVIDNDTIVIVTGDHGSTDEGDHGGETKLETETFLFAYSKTPIFKKQHGSLYLPTTIPQIDLVPTLAALTNVPIPYSSFGKVIPEFFVNDSNDWNNTYKLYHIYKANYLQFQNIWDMYNLQASFTQSQKDWVTDMIHSIIAAQASIDKSLTPLSMNESRQLMENYNNVVAKYLAQLQMYARKDWISYNYWQMSAGLIFLVVNFVCLVILVYLQLHIHNGKQVQHFFKAPDLSTQNIFTNNPRNSKNESRKLTNLEVDYNLNAEELGEKWKRRHRQRILYFLIAFLITIAIFQYGNKIIKKAFVSNNISSAQIILRNLGIASLITLFNAISIFYTSFRLYGVIYGYRKKFNKTDQDFSTKYCPFASVLKEGTFNTGKKYDVKNDNIRFSNETNVFQRKPTNDAENYSDAFSSGNFSADKSTIVCGDPKKDFIKHEERMMIIKCLPHLLFYLFLCLPYILFTSNSYVINETLVTRFTLITALVVCAASLTYITQQRFNFTKLWPLDTKQFLFIFVALLICIRFSLSDTAYSATENFYASLFTGKCRSGDLESGQCFASDTFFTSLTNIVESQLLPGYWIGLVKAISIPTMLYYLVNVKLIPKAFSKTFVSSSYKSSIHWLAIFSYTCLGVYVLCENIEKDMSSKPALTLLIPLLQYISSRTIIAISISAYLTNMFKLIFGRYMQQQKHNHDFNVNNSYNTLILNIPLLALVNLNTATVMQFIFLICVINLLVKLDQMSYRFFNDTSKFKILPINRFHLLAFIWVTFSNYGFFVTHHQNEISAIKWKSGFIGMADEHIFQNASSNIKIISKYVCGEPLKYVSGYLIISNTFTSQILTFLVYNNLIKRTKENDEDVKKITGYMGLLFVKLMCSTFSVFIHRRHLMLWAVFFPRFIYAVCEYTLITLLFLIT